MTYIFFISRFFVLVARAPIYLLIYKICCCCCGICLSIQDTITQSNTQYAFVLLSCDNFTCCCFLHLFGVESFYIPQLLPYEFPKQYAVSAVCWNSCTAMAMPTAFECIWTWNGAHRAVYAIVMLFCGCAIEKIQMIFLTIVSLSLPLSQRVLHAIYVVFFFIPAKGKLFPAHTTHKCAISSGFFLFAFVLFSQNPFHFLMHKGVQFCTLRT